MRRATPAIIERERFTPTCVGNASECAIMTMLDAVHPHVRGECFGAIKDPMALPGSPPRAWGMQVHH